MANSYVEITSTGSTSVPFSFSYLNESEIKVYVDGVEDTSKTLLQLTSYNSQQPLQVG